MVGLILVHVLAKKKKKILGHAGGHGLPWVWSLAWVVGVDQYQWGGGCWLREKVVNPKGSWDPVTVII